MGSSGMFRERSVLLSDLGDQHQIRNHKTRNEKEGFSRLPTVSRTAGSFKAFLSYPSCDCGPQAGG